ncbi:uncharacterized protein J3D65DRAFT_600408 [Phyllosticta citribraziliensis]|uniref:Uncharacterized protein n=1 Tax=Phyllosticta citribraziliensis TaxID=989973 RepID=A0ABR1M513_9PEZI
MWTSAGRWDWTGCEKIGFEMRERLSSAADTATEVREERTGDEGLTPLYLQGRQGEVFRVRNSCDIKRQPVSMRSKLLRHLRLPQLKYRHQSSPWPVVCGDLGPRESKAGRFVQNGAWRSSGTMRASKKRATDDVGTSRWALSWRSVERGRLEVSDSQNSISRRGVEFELPQTTHLSVPRPPATSYILTPLSMLSLPRDLEVPSHASRRRNSISVSSCRHVPAPGHAQLAYSTPATAPTNQSTVHLQPKDSVPLPLIHGFLLLMTSSQGFRENHDDRPKIRGALGPPQCLNSLRVKDASRGMPQTC